MGIGSVLLILSEESAANVEKSRDAGQIRSRLAKFERNVFFSSVSAYMEPKVTTNPPSQRIKPNEITVAIKPTVMLINLYTMIPFLSVCIVFSIYDET